MQVPGFSDSQHEKLAQISRWVHVEAEYSDRALEDAFSEHRVVNKGLVQRLKWGSLQDAWDKRSESTTRRVDKAYNKSDAPAESMAALEMQLKDSFGFVAFCRFDEGETSAVTVLGRTGENDLFAVRLGQSVSGRADVFKAGHERSFAPHLLPLVGSTEVEGFMEAQVLRFVSCTDHVPQKRVLNQLFQKLYEGTCFDPDSFLETDFSGSGAAFVVVDPGHIPYSNDFYKMKTPDERSTEVIRSIHLVMQRAIEWKLPQELIPMVPDLKNGGYKHKLQDNMRATMNPTQTQFHRDFEM